MLSAKAVLRMEVALGGKVTDGKEIAEIINAIDSGGGGGSVTGTGVAQQVAYWASPTALAGTPGFTFDGSNLTLPNGNLLPFSDEGTGIGGGTTIGSGRFAFLYLSQRVTVGADDGGQMISALRPAALDLANRSVGNVVVTISADANTQACLFNSDVSPDSDDAHNLGSLTGPRWAQAYLSQYLSVGLDQAGSSVIYIGAADPNPKIIMKDTTGAQVELHSLGTNLNILGSLSMSSNLRVSGNLGVGNSASATTPGSVVKKIQVFDASGTSLGFLAVYSSIT